MRHRPWPIIVLACFYFLGPILNTLGGAFVMKMSYLEYVSALFRYSDWIDLISALALYPLAGFAIYSVKAWSYPVYLGVMAVTIWGNYQDFRHFSGIFTLPVFIATGVLNIGLVSYFLIPAVRAAYFNRRLRWWEAKPRYELSLLASLECMDPDENIAPMKCTLVNISEGGAFVKSSKRIALDKEYRIRFSLLEQEFCLRTRIAHRLWGGMRGYGLVFLHDTESRKRMVRLSRGLALLGTGARNASWTPAEAWLSFKAWLGGLFSTGKGWVPEVPRPGPVASVLPFKRKPKREKRAA